MFGTAHFKRSVQRYGRTPEPETPFQRAGQVWDERIGSARAQAKNWRLMAFGSLFLSAGLGGGILWQSTQSRVVPYVVEVDHLGEARAISEAEAGYHPTDPQIAWHLARFITDVRAVSLDPVVVRERWLEAYAHTTRRGAQFLSDYARAADPFSQLGEHTVSVQVTSVVRASDRSFQVKWIETAFARGAETGRSHWTAILTVIVKPPTSAEALRKNPLGLYVDAIDWSREIEPPPAPTGSAGPPSSSRPPNLDPAGPDLASAPTASITETHP
jgi:type IV secretory pathway TrbF-like protein